MRIVLYSLNFSPELTGTGKYSGEMAAWLAARGHEVRVIAAPPYYPEWRIGPGYSGWWYTVERDPKAGGGQAGCLVYRCPLYVPRRPSGGRRLVHLLSFAILSVPVLLRLLFRRADVVWVVEPTLACAPGAWILAKLTRAKAWLHVQDFEVDMAFEMGLLRWAPLRLVVLWAERFWMRRFDRVSTITGRMSDKLIDRGVSQSRASLFPNWADIDGIYSLPRPSTMRAQLGFSEDDVVVLYSGNMGQKQGLETVLEAIRLLESHHRLHFVLCGDGAARESLVALASGLSNVQWLPLQPLDQLNELLNLADIHLLPQRADAADMVMPSKLTNMLASGRPVVATALPNTEVYSVVSGRGINTPPGDAACLANALSQLADDVPLRRNLGHAARNYAEKHLSKDTILQQFESELLKLVRG